MSTGREYESAGLLAKQGDLASFLVEGGMAVTSYFIIFNYLPLFVS